MQGILPNFELMTQMQIITFMIAQLCGLVMMILCTVIGQINNFSRILVLKVVANVMQALSNLLLAAYSGALIALLAAIISGLVFVMRAKGKQPGLAFFVCTLMIYCGALLTTYKSLWDIFSFVAGILFIVGICAKTTTQYRVVVLISSVMWAPYDFIVMGYVNLINHLSMVVSYSVGIVRMDLLKKKEA